jgi:hypothetical protein
MNYPTKGDWHSPETDQSRNRLELSGTTEPGVLAIRNTFDSRQPPIFATGPQLMALADAVQHGNLKRIVEGARQVPR